MTDSRAVVLCSNEDLKATLLEHVLEPFDIAQHVRFYDPHTDADLVSTVRAAERVIIATGEFPVSGVGDVLELMEDDLDKPLLVIGQFMQLEDWKMLVDYHERRPIQGIAGIFESIDINIILSKLFLNVHSTSIRGPFNAAIWEFLANHLKIFLGLEEAW